MSSSWCNFAAIQSGHCPNQENKLLWGCSAHDQHTWAQKRDPSVVFLSGHGGSSSLGWNICVLLVLISVWNTLHFYAWIWSLAHMQISVPQTMVSFHKSSQTRRQLWEGTYKVIFVMLLKKCLKIMWEAQSEEIWETQHYTSQSTVSSWNPTFHFSS